MTRDISRAPWLLALLATLLVMTALFALDTGATAVHLHDLWQPATDVTGQAAQLVLRDIRAPRIVMACLTGAALAVAGTIMQGLFRNPLADPGLAGVSSAAALATACIIVLGGSGSWVSWLGRWAIPCAGIAGSFTGMGLLYLFATRGGVTSMTAMLLAGVAFGAFSGALTGVLIFRANDAALRDLTFWTMGSFSGATWGGIGLLLPFLLVAGGLAAYLAAPLNAMLLNEHNAHLMGYPVERIKSLSMLAVACATGPAVSLVGAIGFVGVVVPHLVRLVAGPDHRIVLPASAMLGAILLTGADTMARTLASPAEVPVGIVTALLGTPAFVWLLARSHRTGIA
ncbi:iron ABC transporter permease [Komagataeibacter oboediens]|uniref:FecCD family ABC transporter permease n=1 Tax=Komagataeibacter oboediens TaxID=65958 RepID=UPI001906DE80|nr:iron ABC transporter permease [Komagataeibacter oboediens]MBV0889564.1 iron ABC transporter permease [Komagataeibacter oboediens]MCK9821675.1 iron ABC transporter permease [Komagataeibacter oboediens]GCE79039.1 transmembrane permease component of haem ABC transporter [Komagataeibacter oboediens]